MIDPGMIRKLQSDLHTRMDKMSEELGTLSVEGSAGGGVVKVVASGNREIKEITIGPEAIDPDDPEMLQDLVIAAVNQALDAAKKLQEDKMSSITGGLKFPGLL
ncbi:MAG: nucleoid-associated protein EbfC [Candidatus Sumerlaeota bacterium]|nr:nucleoid-associated protein EbfC [Candidatus Sumerlaeota bacterium]